MLPNRIHTSKTARDQLHLIKQRTGVTPNLIARLAIARSIEQRFDYKTTEPDANGLEFNISTLLGEQALLYERLLVELHGTEDVAELSRALVSHLDNGLGCFKGIRDINDLLARLP
jgi:Domain of unknown function (DUF1832).